MSIKKILYIAIGVFLILVAGAIYVTTKLNPSLISTDPYRFIETFFNQWSSALGAAGTIILAISVFLVIYENRRREERGKEQAIHALHNEIHWNLRPIITLRYNISEWLNRVKEARTISPEPEDLYQPIETRVFDDMRSRGQLHWLEELRMDIVFCYGLIDTYNLDRSFKHKHLELLMTLHDRLDKTIRALEAKFKFLPRYVKYNTSENVVQQEVNDSVSQSPPQELVDEFYSIRREHFLSEGLIYFLGSAYVMQASQEQVSSITFLGWSIPWLKLPFASNVAIAVLLFLGAVLLFSLSFIHRPHRLADKVQSITSTWRILPFMVFVLSWILSIGALISKSVTTLFVTPYFYMGFVLVLLIPAQQWIEWHRSRKRNQETRKN